jgi:hypothetical protein
MPKIYKYYPNANGADWICAKPSCFGLTEHQVVGGNRRLIVDVADCPLVDEAKAHIEGWVEDLRHRHRGAGAERLGDKKAAFNKLV